MMQTLAGARAHLASLSAHERARYDGVGADGVHQLNTAQAIRELAQAGADKSLPRDSAALDAEISSIESLMRQRRAYDRK